MDISIPVQSHASEYFKRYQGIEELGDTNGVD